MRFGTLVLVVAMWVAAPAVADIIVINNGLAPPNPANVLDEANSFPSTVVLVQNVGCNSTLQYPCPLPWGDPTSVELIGPPDAPAGVAGSLSVYESSAITVSGGVVQTNMNANDSSTLVVSGGIVGGSIVASQFATVAMTNGDVGGFYVWDSANVMMTGGFAYSLSAQDTSTATISGGSLASLSAFDSSNVTLNGGRVSNEVAAYDSTTVTLSDGSLASLYASGFSQVTMSGSFAEQVAARDFATVTISSGSVQFLVAASDLSAINIVGSDFAVDEVPVTYGVIPWARGRLTGTLRSGEPIDSFFCHNGCRLAFETYTGLITLVPEPDSVLLGIAGVLSVLGLSASRRRRAN